jgi:hypothetical protein
MARRARWLGCRGSRPAGGGETVLGCKQFVNTVNKSVQCVAKRAGADDAVLRIDIERSHWGTCARARSVRRLEMSEVCFAVWGPLLAHRKRSTSQA